LNDPGILHTDFLEETTASSGVLINNSILKIGSSASFLNDSIFTGNINLESSVSVTPNVLKITNSAGGVSVFSSGNKGIVISETTGNVLLTSTADSVDAFTGSLITTGGVLVGKTLNVKDSINGLDGIHTFTNTVPAEHVMEVTNTSSSGFSSTRFNNNSGLSKLEIGYGNGLVGAPLTSTAYIQSTNGSSLLFRGDSTDSFKISTDSSLDFYNTTASTNITAGAMRILGGVSISNATDASSVSSGGSFTTGGGLSVAKQVYFGGSVNMSISPAPSNPSSGIERLYVDDADGLLRSRRNDGTVTTYQPTTTKGDLMSHNGTTQDRLPVGQDGYVLSANSSQPLGMEWVFNGSGSGTSSSNKYNLTTINSKTVVIENPLGTYCIFTYPLVESGASCNFFISKSTATVNGVVVRLNSNRSLTNNGNLVANYPAYKGVQISKPYSEGDGNYVGNTNEFFNYTLVTLSSNTWTSLGPNYMTYIGCLCISVSSLAGGPSATFIISKNISTLANGNITTIVSSPSATFGVLQVRWQALGQLEIRKTNGNNDGTYNIVDNFQDTSINTTITLTGTAQTTVDSSVFNYFENKSFMLKVTSSIANAPNAIFLMSKNSPSISGSSSVFRSPGGTTGEQLNIQWGVNSKISLSKSGTGYNGTYSLVFTKLT
jgi:hypothetical protein